MNPDTNQTIANLRETIALCDEAKRLGYPGAPAHVVASVKRTAKANLRALLAWEPILVAPKASKVLHPCYCDSAYHPKGC